MQPAIRQALIALGILLLPACSLSEVGSVAFRDATSGQPGGPVEQLRLLADSGDSTSQACLGWAYLTGNGAEKDFKSAVFWLRKAADQNEASAQTWLGVAYFNGDGVVRDYAAAIDLWVKAANHGDARARCYIRACYARGIGRSQKGVLDVFMEHKSSSGDEDLIQDTIWSIMLRVPLGFGGIVERTRALAESGNVNAQTALGSLYGNGRFVAEDKSESVKWYRKAAEQGSLFAQGLLTYQYSAGRGVSVDNVEAYKWALIARGRSLVGSQVRVEQLEKKLSLEEQGEGLRRATESMRLITERVRILAESGDADAQYALGALYGSDRFSPKDESESMKWYKRAAEQGVLEAQVVLSFAYHNGQGVRADKVEAYKWALVVRDKSPERLAKWILELEKNLSTEDRTEGLRRSKETSSMISAK